MTAGKSTTNSEPTLRPTTMMSVLASAKRSSSIGSRTNARMTRMPVSCSRITRFTPSSLTWKERKSGTMRPMIERRRR